MGARRVGVIFAYWRRLLRLVAVVAGGLALLGAQGASADGVPIKVRFGGDTQATRVVLDVAQAFDGRVVSSDNPRQVIVDFPHVAVDAANGTGQGLVKDWSLERSGGNARLILNLSAAAQVDKRFSLPPAEGVAFYRYVIDLKGSGQAAAMPAGLPASGQVLAAVSGPVVKGPAVKGEAATTASSATSAVATPSTATKASPPVPAPAAIKVSSRRPLAKKVIVIDAGHGGHNSGALGAHVQEKQVTLAAARALKTRLEKTGHYKVVLTRSDDTFIPLEERVRISRAAHADLFISLHADSGEDTSTRGASIYTLSDHGSERVAAKASSDSDWGINAGAAASNKAVREILFDLTQRFTRNKSAAFAETLIQNVGEDRPILTRAHRDAGYVVLFAPDVPAVLLEMGFITNPADEALLTDAKKRQALCESIAQSIDSYFSAPLVTASL